MKQSIIGSLFVLLLFPVLAGAETDDPYEMLLSKDDSVCSRILEVVNGSIEKDGNIKYAHPMFKAIEWKRMESRGEKFRPYLMAHFDIDNDGRDEIVTMFSTTFKDSYTDSIYIFEENNDEFPSFTEPWKMWENNDGKFPEGGPGIGSYVLKEAPPIGQVFGKPAYPSVSGWMTIRPFVYHGSSYLAVTNKDKIWFVIGTYQAPGTLNDVCYFQHKKVSEGHLSGQHEKAKG